MKELLKIIVIIYFSYPSVIILISMIQLFSQWQMQAWVNITIAEVEQVLQFLEIHSSRKSYIPNSGELTNSDLIFINRGFGTEIWVTFKELSTFYI